MPLLKRELHKRIKGPLANDEAWWRLVFDTDPKRLYVEYEWSNMDLAKGGRIDSGTAEFDVGTFLSQDRNGPAQQELARLISSLFGGQTDA